MTGHLRDPESDDARQPGYIRGAGRAINEEYLVVIGLCTHLGCSPLYRPKVEPGDGIFFCPCHGSKFDLSGRVFKDVPAPRNLDIPPHQYVTNAVIEIGVDRESA